EGGILDALREAERLHHPAVDREARSLEREALRGGEGDLRLPVPVQVGDLALAGAVGPTHEDLGRGERRRGREGDHPAVRARGRSRDTALTPRDADGRARAVGGNTIEGEIAPVLDRERDPRSVG